MILLTDEEIKVIIEPMIMIDPKIIAKAQLRKVYENKLYEFIDENGKRCISIDKIALLKEMED